MADSTSDTTVVPMTGVEAAGNDSPVDVTDQRTIKPFYVLLSELSKELLKCELQQARLLCSNQEGVPAGKLETKDPVELLRVLDECGIIGEDNTHFLKELLEKSGCDYGRVWVEEYDKERREHLKNVEILLGRKDPFFVGRTTFVSRILEVFRDQSHKRCRCVLVYGLAGTGKTKLAGESCAIYKEQVRSGARLFRVNLRKATEMEEVGLWILNTVTGKQITQGQFDMALVRSWIMNCSQDTILLLDNADDILNPSSYSKDHFVNTLTDLLSITNHLVKILLTSRHPVDFVGLRELDNFVEIKLEPLPVNESLELLTKMVTHAQKLSGPVSVGGEALRDDEALIEVAKLCGNNPKALRAVASRLSSGFSPKDLVEALECPEDAQRVLDPGSLGASAAVQDERKDFEDQTLVLHSLNAMYEQLPPHLKEALLKLSVFPSSFSLSQGAKILGKDRPSAARFDLEDLKKWSLVDRDDFSITDTGMTENEPYYYMHPLVRSVCLSKIPSNEMYKLAYEDALRRFLKHIEDLLKELTQLGHTDFVRALAKFESDKTNVLHYLELGMGNKFGCRTLGEKENTNSPIPFPETKEGLFSIFETFLDPSKRLEYYENMSIRMQASGEPEAWAYLRGWMGDELYVRAKYDEAWKAVEEPLRVLETRASGPSGRTDDLERARAQLLYVKGRILVAKRKYKDGIAVLKQALSIQERLLGNHTLTARCLNGLGHAYFTKTDEYRHSTGSAEAHEYHMKAWEMLVKITGGKPEKHFDGPMYLLNIGATFHEMGKKRKSSDKEKAKEYFQLAIKNYEEAYDLEKALKLSNSPNTAFVLKNMAMSYCEMEEYEKAVPLATEAVNIREETIGVHPTTARNLFFIGSLYDSLGDECKKLKKPEDIKKVSENYNKALEFYNRAFRMEVKLGPSNHSIEYDDLKEDMKCLLGKMHMDRELDNYRRMFKKADSGTLHFENEGVDSTSESGDVSPSRKRSPRARDLEEGCAGVGHDGDEMAGPSRGRAPGPVFPDEYPSKRSKCSLS
ncbi:uncharacterized protein LOC110985352 [Acanthaster planci]|uniref:Uncharacterized protein LOC110985352 n=1 Tax=Acanthaster planci TaxID=133434 RepID=A0A8B7ZFK8_ACAPL|nr:uncharacterized protein LOC110985352 [Acanthaster planci]